MGSTPGRAVRTADVERRGWGWVKGDGGGGLSYDIRKSQYWGIGGGGGGGARVTKKKVEKGEGERRKKRGSSGLPPVGTPGMARGVRDESMATIAQ